MTTFNDLLVTRQAEVGISDVDLCQALGFSKIIVLNLIKAGTMHMPLTKVPALAEALSMNPEELLTTLLRETNPELLELIQKTFKPAQLTATETNLIRHIRGLIGDRPCAPMVIDGASVIALVAA